MLGILSITGCTKAASEKPSEAVSASKESVENNEMVTNPSVESSSQSTAQTPATSVEKEPEKPVKETAPVQNPKGRGKVYYNLFDTVSYVYSYAGDSDDRFLGICDEVYDILNDYHMMFDIYYEYSGVNNLKTINLNAGGEPIPVDARLIKFLQYAKELYELTSGEMNIMMGSVLSIWHEARNASAPYIPSSEKLTEANRYVGFDYLEIDEENGTVRITDPRASIDVGALGKGYATEMAARYLESIGAEHYVLNIGGNIRIVGTKVDGSGWVTGIRNPKDPDNSFSLKVNISDCACVTSGSYERYFTVNGVKYPHIIDKDTLQPARYYESLTVITKDSGLADALSTALYCMPYEDGLKLVESLKDVGCVWIFSNGSIRYTPNLKDIVINV